MKKLMFLIVITFLSTSFYHGQLAQGKSGGVIYIKDSGVVKFLENRTDSFDVLIEKIQNYVTINVSEVKEIVQLAPKGFKITLRDGREITTPTLSIGVFEYYLYDEVNGKKIQSAIHMSSISKIVFQEDVGNLKHCPKCNKWWPSDFIFCPYDSTKLLWDSQ